MLRLFSYSHLQAFIIARHLFPPWASSFQSILPHPTSWRSIVILSSHLCLGLPNGLFLSGFPTKIPHIPLLFFIRATCPVLLILLDFITRTIMGEKYRSFKPLIMYFSPLSCYLVHPSPKYLPEHPIVRHRQPTFFLNMIDQVSHPYKTTGEIIVLFTLIFIFLDSKWKDKKFCTEYQQAFTDFNLLLISSCMEFWFINVVPKF